MIIIKTTNGDCFINEAETIQVKHIKDRATVYVLQKRFSDNGPTPNFEINDVEAVIYTNIDQTVKWQDEGSALKGLQDKYDEQIEWGKQMRSKYMELMNECDDLRERLAKLEPQPKDYENDLLRDTVYNEMERIETEERERQRREHPNWRSLQKSGNGIRFLNIAKANDIETVGQLLAVGRARFEKFKFMGPKCIAEVSQALENLYDIKQW